MRKTLLLTLLSLLTVFAAGAAPKRTGSAVKAPDFAYPKTVIADAEKAFDAALKSGNEKDQLKAAIQIYLADISIDNSSSDKSIRAFDKRVSKFGTKSVKAVATLFKASAYEFALNQDRYKYRQRDLPLTPRPADLSEWSEGMFKAVIDSLAREAYSLSDKTPIEEFEGIVIADDLTRSFFPTVRDFVAVYMIGNMPYLRTAKENTELCREIADMHPSHSNPWYAWNTLAITSDNNLIGKKETEAYLDLYKSQPQETGRAYTLNKILFNLDNIRKTHEQQVAFADSALTVFKGYWIENQIVNTLNELLNPFLSISSKGENAAAENEKVSLKIEYANTRSAIIRIYNFKDRKTAQSAYKSGLGAYKPVQEYKMNFGRISSDTRDTTLTVTLPRGCNAIVGDMPDADYKKDPPLYIDAYELSPVVITQGKHRVLYVLDASTGAPVKDVTASAVSTRKGNKVTTLGKTDSNGRLIFDCPKESNLRLTYRNHSHTYKSVYFHNYSEARENQNNIGITTDLGVYKLGAEVRYAGFVADTLGAIAGQEIEVELLDTEYKTISTAEVKSDSFGRFTGSFKLPEETRTGQFRIQASDEDNGYDYTYFQVSDFKMPAFKGDSIAVYGAGPTKPYITAEGRIITYSDFPVSDARINIKVNSVDSIFTTTTDLYGRFSLRVDSVFDCEDVTTLDKKELIELPYEDYSDNSSVTISATSPDGTTLEVFNGNVSQYPNKLEVKIKDTPIDSDSVLTVKATLLSPQKKEIKGDLVWRIENGNDSTILSGKAIAGDINIDITSLKPDSYQLKIAPADALAEVSERELTVYSMHSVSLPEGDLIWSPDRIMKAEGGKLTARILVASPGANIFYGPSDSPAEYKHEFLSAGWHTLSVKPTYTESTEVKVFTLRNIKESTISWDVLKKTQEPKLNLTIESFRDKVYTSDNEKWTLSVKDEKNRPVEAAIVLDVYNSRLNVFEAPDNLMPARAFIYKINPSFNFQGRGWSIPFQIDGEYKTLQIKAPLWPTWNTYNLGIFLDMNLMRSASGSKRLYGARAPMGFGAADLGLKLNDEMTVAYGVTPRKQKVAAAGIEVLEESVVVKEDAMDSAEAPEEEAEAGSSEKVEVRDSGAPDVFSALWMPSIVTDAQGRYDLDFKVPNVLTTWQVVVTAWDRKMNSAHFNKTISVSKPVMVSANMPRFVRAGDRTTVISTVMNNTDAPMTIRVNAEAFDVETDSTFATITRDLSINPGAKETVSNDINVPTSMQNSKLGFRVTAISKDYSDGEQIAVPVLDAESFVREAINFYLNPGDTEYSTDLPKAKGRDFKSEFTFTANPMATILDALPTLWNDPFPTATSLSTAYYGARIVLSIAKEHPSVAEKFDLKEVEKQSEDALKKLYDLQRADGGWAWGSWSSESSEWVTTAILDKFYDLKRLNYLPDIKKLRESLTSAVRYIDSRVRDYDLTYAIIRPEFNSLTLPSLNGQKVIDRTLNDITRQWKKYDADAKALSVIALANNSRMATARGIIKSLDQFAYDTPKKGTQFRNERSLIAYGHLLEAYAAADPKSRIVDGLRQYLIVRRQATDWGNRGVTAYVVSSFLNSGTRWAQPTVTPALYLDNSTTPSTMSAPAGDAMVYSATLPTDAKTLRLDVGNAGVPSYGAIVTSYVAPMQDIKAYSEDDEISVEKRLLVRDASGKMQDAPKVLQVGQTVTVSITLKTTRPMSYVNVTDQRPATFEPVDQMSHYVGPSFWRASTGNDVPHYRENRDASTRILIDYLPEGTHVISYDVTVNNAGTYASGIVTATCDRAPSLTAHSAGSILEVKP